MQVIKYKWENWKPVLVCKDNGGFSRISLMGSDISLELGKKKCIGFFKEGTHFDCPNMTEISYGWHCNSCRIEDSFFTCIQCDGSSCLNEDRRNECMKEKYYVYLVAFGTMLKVGVSHERRLLERWVEQGADFGARVVEVTDGKSVRVMEQKIKNHLGITDRLSGKEKQKMIFCDPNVAASNILGAIKKLKGSFSISRLEIYDMRKHYNLQNVITSPQKVDLSEGMKISGKVVAAKGNILILSSDYDFFSINAHDMIGREISI